MLAKAIKTGLYPNDATNKLAELDITLVFHARTAKHVTEERLASKIQGKRGKTNMHMGHYGRRSCAILCLPVPIGFAFLLFC